MRRSSNISAAACAGARARRPADRWRRAPDCELGFRTFDTVVVAAGAWSKELARQVGDHVLFDTERGYHLNLEPGEAGELRRSVMFEDRGFVLAPMLDGVRLTYGRRTGGRERAAGLLAHPANAAGGARGIAGIVRARDPAWMGYRPRHRIRCR